MEVPRATLGRRVREARAGVACKGRRCGAPSKVSAWAIDELVGQLHALKQFGIGFNHGETWSMLRAPVEAGRGRPAGASARPTSYNALDAALKRNADKTKFQTSRNPADSEVVDISLRRVVQHYAELASLVHRYPELATDGGRWMNADETGLESRARDTPSEKVAVGAQTSAGSRRCGSSPVTTRTHTAACSLQRLPTVGAPHRSFAPPRTLLPLGWNAQPSSPTRAQLSEGWRLPPPRPARCSNTYPGTGFGAHC